MVSIVKNRIIRQISVLAMLSLNLLVFTNCNQSAAPTVSPSYSSPAVPAITGTNVMSITVGCGYVNQPCVSVTICAPGSTTNCQTIPNLLLDTGSVGIRIFSSVVNSTLSAALPAVKNGTVPYGACAVYGDGSYQWGPVRSADVVIGQMPTVNMPIELVDFTFGDGGTACKNSNGVAISQDAPFAGYNGIIGIEFFLNDCGSKCVAAGAPLPYYFTCTSGGSVTCSATNIPLASQLANPIGAQATDNNGYYIILPAVTSSGAYSPTGYLVFGIGTRANNSPGTGLTVLTANTSNGQIQTTYNGTTYTTAIIDSGSNAIYFPSTLTVCASPLASFYCPGVGASVTAIQKNSAATISSSITFTVTNANQMYSPGNAFSTLAGPAPSGLSGYFDWGLPFFFGRTVWGGMETRSAAGVGTGPYWAY